MTDEDSFCIYCQRQYASVGRLKRHLRLKHEGTYAQVNLAPNEGDPPPEPGPLASLVEEESGIDLALASTDAGVWAKAFIATLDAVTVDPTDEGLMTGWFANAIEAGRSAAGPQLDRNEVIRHLEEAHCVIWGQVHDASSVKGREKAADWVMDLFDRMTSGFDQVAR